MYAVNQLKFNDKNMETTKCKACNEKFDFEDHQIKDTETAKCPGCGKVVNKNGLEIIKQVTKNNMDEKIVNQLNDQITGLNEEKKAINKLVEDLKAENKAFKDQFEKIQDEQVEMILDAAIKADQIVETAKAELKLSFKGNPEGLKKVIASIKPAHKDIRNVIDFSEAEKLFPSGIKTLREWEKKDPQAVEYFANANREAYNRLVEKEYGVKL